MITNAESGASCGQRSQPRRLHQTRARTGTSNATSSTMPAATIDTMRCSETSGPRLSRINGTLVTTLSKPRKLKESASAATRIERKKRGLGAAAAGETPGGVGTGSLMGEAGGPRCSDATLPAKAESRELAPAG